MHDNQQSFKLANITVHPATDEISCDGKTIEIKSMAMKVLCYFATRNDQVVSRDSLREDVWQNPTASNHTINNHIYSLRQTLAKLDGETKFFHTVTGSKGGYRLVTAAVWLDESDIEQAQEPEALASNQADDSAIATSNAVEMPSNQMKGKRSKLVYVSGLILGLTLLLALLVFLFSTPKMYDKSDTLTIQAGREQSPAISDDGEILIYSNRVNRTSPWQLYAKKLNPMSDAQKVFLEEKSNDNFVSISPNKRYIAFIRYTNEYGIYIADFNPQRLTASNAKLIIPLDDNNLSPAITWLDNSQFFYTAQQADNAPLRVYQYNLALDRSEQVTSPPLNSSGDFAVMASPNKQWLAIMRAKSSNGFSLFLYDLQAKSLLETPVESIENNINVSFSDDSGEVYFVDQQGFLSSYNIASKQIARISSQKHLGYWPLKVPNKQQFIMQQDWGLSSLTTQIIRINNPITGGDGSSEVLVNNNMSIRSIAGIDNDGLLFASIKPNFHVELWKYKQGQASKLVAFNEKPEYRYPLSIDWHSASESALLSINNSCRLISIVDGKDTPLCPDNENLYAARFSNDATQLFIPGFKQGEPSAVKIGASGYPLTKLTKLKSANSIHQDKQGNFYYSKEPGYDIYAVDKTTGEERKIIERTHINNRYSVNDFVVTSQGIYYMDRVAVTQNAIYFYRFADESTSYVVKSKDNYPNIVLSDDEKYLYLIESVDNNSALLLIN